MGNLYNEMHECLVHRLSLLEIEIIQPIMLALCLMLSGTHYMLYIMLVSLLPKHKLFILLINLNVNYNNNNYYYQCSKQSGMRGSDGKQGSNNKS